MSFRDMVLRFMREQNFTRSPFLTALVLTLWFGSIAFAQTPAADPQPCFASKANAAGNICRPAPVAAQQPSATSFVVQQPPAGPPEEKLKAWVPLFQSALWVLLISCVLIGFRKNVAALIDRTKSVDLGPIRLSTQPEPMEPPSTAMPETVPIEVSFE